MCWCRLPKIIKFRLRLSETTACQSGRVFLRHDTIRYDSVYLTCSKKLTSSQLSLPHGTNKKLKCKTKNKMMSVIGWHSWHSVVWWIKMCCFYIYTSKYSVIGTVQVRIPWLFWIPGSRQDIEIYTVTSRSFSAMHGMHCRWLFVVQRLKETVSSSFNRSVGYTLRT